MEGIIVDLFFKQQKQIYNDVNDTLELVKCDIENVYRKFNHFKSVINGQMIIMAFIIISYCSKEFTKKQDRIDFLNKKILSLDYELKNIQNEITYLKEHKHDAINENEETHITSLTEE